jgi:hypothetical protein
LHGCPIFQVGAIGIEEEEEEEEDMEASGNKHEFRDDSH